MLIESIKPSIVNSCGYLNVVANNIGKLTLRVCDTQGRIAKKICQDIIAGVQQLEVNISDLSDGTYILNAFHNDMFVQSFKFTKQ